MEITYPQNHHSFTSNSPRSPIGILTQNDLYFIFQFLDLKDVILCSQVSKNWKKIAERHYKLLRSFTIQTYEDIAIYHALSSFLELQEINIQTKIIDVMKIMTLLNEPKSTVKALKINLNLDDPRFLSLLFMKLILVFPSIESFKYYGREINEDDLKLFQKFQSLKEFYLLEDCYIEGKFFSHLKPLEVLVIHSHFVKFKNIENLLKSSKQLRKITLDLEEYEEEDISCLVDILREYNLSSLDFKYCNNIQNEHLMAFIHQSHLQKLSLRKVYDISGSTYSNFFERKFSELEKLHFSMNNGINSQTLINIAHGCENLRILDLTWCENVEDSRGIYEILLKCGNLEKLLIVGIKKATEAAFPVVKEYYSNTKITKLSLLNSEEKEKIQLDLKRIRENDLKLASGFKFYQNLKFIDATKCDFVPDEVFLLLLLINPNIDARNYYEEQVTFPIYGQPANYEYQ